MGYVPARAALAAALPLAASPALGAAGARGLATVVAQAPGSPNASAAPAPEAVPATASAGDPFVGTWQGVLRPGALTLRLSLAVRRDAAGALAGILTSVDQGNAQIPAAVAARGDTLVVSASSLGIAYTGVLGAGRDSLRGTFAQGGATFPLAFGRGAPPAVRRPQDPVPPLPYREELVTVASAGGVRLAGTLSIPPGPGPFPAVVFVSGSGPQDRDAQAFNHRPFRVIADHLARRGIAVLRYDDRGVAGSSGDFARATSADFADDAEAAVRFLRTRPEVARDRVGIVGHSEGGLIGPMVAARSADVAFLVLLAGPGLRGDSILTLQGAALARGVGADEAGVSRQVSMQRRLLAAVREARDSADASTRFAAAVDTVLAGVPPRERPALAEALGRERDRSVSPWMRFFVGYDPAPTLRRVRVPVLALNGTRDVQVPHAENLRAIGAALAAGGNRDHRELALPGLNHLFQTARTGQPAEYGTIDETVAPAALDAISRWIAVRFVARR